MTRRRMGNLYKALEAIGLVFEECDCSMMNKYQGGNDDVISIGILRDFDGSVITDTRLKKILDIAKKKKSYMLLPPMKKELQIKRNVGSGTIRLNANDMVVCFIQAGLIDTFKDAYSQVDNLLKRHFLHFQEDEDILELESALNILFAQIREFEFLAYELLVLRMNSSALSRSLGGRGIVFTRMTEMIGYMNGDVEKKHAATMCFAGQCLRLICSIE